MPTKNSNLLLLRTSERVSFKGCRQRWHWAYNERLSAKKPSNALRFGSLIHDALEAYYKPGVKRGPHPAKTFAKLYKLQVAEMENFGVRDEDGKWEEAGDLGVDMMNNYVRTYGKEDHIKVIAPEMPFQIDLYTPGGKYICTYVGKWDAVIQDISFKKPQTGLMEHKTAASISTDHLWGDEQNGSYWAFAPGVLQDKGILPEGGNIDFVLYNFMRKAMQDKRPQNAAGQYLNKPSKDALLQKCEELGLNLPKKTVEVMTDTLEQFGVDTAQLGEVSKSQPPPYLLRKRVFRDSHDGMKLIQRVQSEVREMKLVRAGKLDVYKRLSKDCNFCEFRDMCELDEAGAPGVKALRKAMFEEWDPYGDHAEMETEEPF